jgi:hypothetical protein
VGAAAYEAGSGSLGVGLYDGPWGSQYQRFVLTGSM